jgi:WXXGXW repeat (2 copies)
MRVITRFAALASVVGLAACMPLPPAGVVYVGTAPPAYRVEVVGVSPGPDFIWIRGYWGWGDAGYYWVPGRWVRRPYAGARWEYGSWRHARGGWYWTPGAWRGRGEHGDRGDHGDRGRGHGGDH